VGVYLCVCEFKNVGIVCECLRVFVVEKAEVLIFKRQLGCITVCDVCVCSQLN
jgi:hypothetical protein